MDIKDTFTNRYFKPENIKAQMDLINQPTEVDSYADAFSGQANRPTLGPAQRNSNALMAGLGAGLKGAANNKRQEQLSPILKMVGELNARSAYMEAQTQEQEQQKMNMVKFLRDNKRAIRDLGNASITNSPEAQEISKYLSNKFEIATGQNPGKFNSFDAKQRKTFYDQPNGTTIGYSFLDAIEPYAEDAYGEETDDVLQNLSPYHSKKYQNTQELQRQKLEKGEADINNVNSQTDHHNAQVGKIEHDINAPKPKYDDSTLSHIRKANSDWINELNAKHKDSAKAVKAQTQMRDAIQTEINEGTWQTGASALAQATRWLNEKTGDVKTKQLLELKRQPLFKDLKNTFGARITDNDLAMWLTTQVDLSTDPNLAIEVLNERIDDSKSEVNEELIRRKILENEFQNSESYNSLLVDERVQEELGTQQPAQNEASGNQNQNMVKATDPDTGEQMLIPAENAEEARTRGLVIDE